MRPPDLRLLLLKVERSITTGADGSNYLLQAARASPPFEPDVSKITDAGGVRIIAVAEHRDIDQVRWRRILPDLGIDASEVDLLVKPTANPVLGCVGNEVWETADVFVVSRLQPIAPDHPP